MNLDASPTPSSPQGPRERALAEGIVSLGDAELIAVVLGTGLAGRPVGIVAAGLLEHAGSLEALARLGPAAIAEHPGVGTTKALRLAAAFELGARAARRPHGQAIVTHSADVAAHMGPRLAAIPHEEIWVLCLDSRNHVRAARKVAQGGLHGSSIQAHDVLRAALYEAAATIILVHNHPSGDPSPSPQDLVLTRRLAEVSFMLGVPLVDHVIVTPSGRYTSMLDLGVLQVVK